MRRPGVEGLVSSSEFQRGRDQACRWWLNVVIGSTLLSWQVSSKLKWQWLTRGIKPAETEVEPDYHTTEADRLVVSSCRSCSLCTARDGAQVVGLKSGNFQALHQKDGELAHHPRHIMTGLAYLKDQNCQNKIYNIHFLSPVTFLSSLWFIMNAHKTTKRSNLSNVSWVHPRAPSQWVLFVKLIKEE